ncbi:hypothetical protein [Verrucomicrobium sp. BvORR034]|uniref:hypothetical protein n=1 Tax=Verrucomicrobium sp. BvORR034 TaxID=1396418 RepID=UPI00067871E5|nr:hypothetical protein [Verrucomicrobium sp. BvORR034]
MNPKLLPLIDRLQQRPLPEVDFAPELIAAGLDAGVIKRIPNGKCIGLTGTGLEQALALRQSGELLFGVDITPAGVRITKDLSRDQCAFLLQRLRMINQMYHAALADVISYTVTTHGEAFAKECLSQLEFDFMEVSKAEAIAKVPILLREHYRLTADLSYILGQKFPDSHAEQEKWAKLARKHSLSALALKRSIDAGQIMTEEGIKEQSGRGSGIVVINGLITTTFKRWHTQVGGTDKILQWEPETRQAFLEEVEPLLELAARVKASLGAA